VQWAMQLVGLDLRNIRTADVFIKRG
jgi:hypothetical protein